MTIIVTGVITGGAQTGLTSPTYTVGADVAPDVNGKQGAVTALGGTQTNVRLHSVSDPFTVTFMRPKIMKMLPSPNPLTGKYGPIPVNTYKWIVRKGVNPAINQAPVVSMLRVEFDVPAGSDAYDSVNLRAALSLLIGELSTNSAGFGDTSVSGVM